MKIMPDLKYIKIPQSDIVEFSTEQDCGGIPLANIQFSYDENNFIYNERKNDNMEKIENKKQDSIDKILEIYRKDIIKIIDETCDENIKEIRENSELGQIFTKVLEYSQKKIKETYPENFEKMKDKIYISFDNDDKIQRKIEEEVAEREQAIESLDERLEDVKALLNITETYEQKMDILKRYEILDEDGLLV